MVPFHRLAPLPQEVLLAPQALQNPFLLADRVNREFQALPLELQTFNIQKNYN